MPIYEYACSACGAEVEVLQKVSDAPLTHCPKCGAEAFAKKISRPSFRLKGGGWYATDFKHKDKPAAKTESGGGDAAPAAAGTDKAASTGAGETKPKQAVND